VAEFPNLLERGSNWLADMRHRHATRTVTYQRGDPASGGASVEVKATIGTTTFEIEDGTGALVKIESRDYLILAADLVLDGEQTPPKQGDVIRETASDGSGKVYVYEVMGPGGASGGPHYRHSDPFRKTLRIHTKLIGEESP
jgi:hypothetical protein